MNIASLIGGIASLAWVAVPGYRGIYYCAGLPASPDQRRRFHHYCFCCYRHSSQHSQRRPRLY